MNSFRLHRDAWQRLVLTEDDGRQHVGVEPIRAFPFSEASRWVALCDSQGHELTLVEDLAALPAETRQILEEELARRHFMPRIQRIASASAESEPTEWQVETDRGAARFLLASEEDVRRLSPTCLLVVDSNGVRYLIPDVTQLDPASQQVLDRYL